MGWNNWLYAERLGQKEQAPKPMTNADRIRAMSDEELAKVIVCPFASELDLYCTKGTCLDCCVEWLQQPAAED